MNPIVIGNSFFVPTAVVSADFETMGGGWGYVNVYLTNGEKRAVAVRPCGDADSDEVAKNLRELCCIIIEEACRAREK